MKRNTVKRTKVVGYVAVACLVFLGMVGCRTIDPPETAYAPWIPPDTNQPDDGVWSEVTARNVETNRALNLSDFIEMGLQYNPSTRQAWDQARQAYAEAQQARSEYYPQVDVSAKIQPLQNNSNAEGEDISYLSYGPGATLQWLLLDLGGRAASVDSALESLLAANYQFNQAIQDEILDVVKAYYGLHAAQESVKAAEQTVQQSKTTLDAAQEKEKAGIGIRVDVLQAESEYNQSLYDLESARGSVEDARAKLALATGLRPDAPFKIEENLPEPPLELKESAISAVIDAAITNRSDLQGLRAQLRASEAAIRSANSDLWPSLSGGVEAGMNKYSGDDRPYDDDYSVIAYVSLSWNIFDGFLDINKKRAAEAARDAARSGLKQAALSAGADVWSSYYAYQTAVKKYQAAKASETSAQAAFDLANDSYKAGLKSILDLLDAQTNLADARSQLINARQAVFTALADLEHATGQLTAKSTVKREEATP